MLDEHYHEKLSYRIQKRNWKYLAKGNTYNFRIVSLVHPSLYAVLDSNYHKIFNPDNYDTYQFRIKPLKSGKYIIRIVFMNKDGYFIVGNPSLEIKLNNFDK